MANKQQIAYALAHREDVEPLRVLYSRRTSDSEATWYSPTIDRDAVPIRENIRIAEEAIAQIIEKDSQS